MPKVMFSVQPGRWCPRYSTLQCTVRGLVSCSYFTVYSQGAGVPGKCTVYRQGAGVPGNVQCTAKGLVSQVMYSVQPGGWCPR